MPYRHAPGYEIPVLGCGEIANLPHGSIPRSGLVRYPPALIRGAGASMNYATPIPKVAERREDPQIICPNCHTGIKLTESLAAPLIAQTRRQYEEKLTQKEREFARRESLLQQQQADLAKAR